MSGRQEPIELHGAPALVLCFDPHLEGPGLEQAGDVVLVADEDVAVPGCRPRARLPLRDFVPWRTNREVEALRPEHVIVHTVRGARPLQLLAAMRHGARWFHLVSANGWGFKVNRRGVMLLGSAWRSLALLDSLPGVQQAEALLGLRLIPPWLSSEATLEGTRLAVELARARPPATSDPRRVTHYLGALHPGGAERQLSYLAAATRARGLEVEVLTMNPLVGEAGHYAPDLARAGVPCRPVPPLPRFTRPRLRDLSGAPLPPRLEDLLERHQGGPDLVPLVRALEASRPDVLHCWLDECNLVGAVAGLAAGVPRIVISTRNLHPGHFPYLHRRWFRDCYHALAASDRVAFVANSAAGADSYAEWADVPRERFVVIPNGFDPAGITPCPADQRSQRRRAAGLDPDAFLVLGVFRLSPEKRPADFLAAIDELSRRIPAPLQAVHVGVGAEEGAVRAEVARRGLGDRLRLFGRRDDARELLALADATLLCSAQEGCPNVSLESQALGVPIVLTRAGGSAETVDDGRTGFVCDVGAVDQLVDRLALLATDPLRRAAMGSAGPAWIAERFGLDAMVERHLELYAKV